jgi:DNA invertase Pin-like site-specific DNA recombinase
MSKTNKPAEGTKDGKFPKTTKTTILYARLSREDGEDGVSNSITNQLTMLRDYAERNDFTPYITIQDDGYSGTNFNRPGWQELLTHIENGDISTLILKDSSRMGRNYLQAGLYRQMFREKGVRLICINDGTDTALGEDDFTPFREIISEWYARDTSKKIKSVLHAKGNSGKHMTNSPIYGYRRSPEDKNIWVIDEESAAIVRRIYQMTVDGKGLYQIACILTDEKILRPTAHIALRDGYDIPRYEDRYNWGGQTIKCILEKLEYLGHTVNFRTYKDSYKDKKFKHRPKEDWVVFENTQSPIIDIQTWETAQKCRKVKRRMNPKGETNPFTGLTYCGDCGSRMYNHRSCGRKSEQYDSYDNYACCQYSKYPPKCTMHYIKTSTLNTLTLAAIQTVSGFVKEHEDEFVRLLHETHNRQSAEAAKAQQKQFVKFQKRHKDLDSLIKQLYEDKVSGQLSAKRFEILSDEYEREQVDLERQIDELQTAIVAYRDETDNTERFISIVRRYTDIHELTPTILNEYINKIVVFEGDKSSGRREQKVDFYFNFIGRVELPSENGNHSENWIENKAPFDPKEHRRTQFRAYYYRNRERILTEKAEQREAAKAEKLIAEAAELAMQPIKTAENKTA